MNEERDVVLVFCFEHIIGQVQNLGRLDTESCLLLGLPLGAVEDVLSELKVPAGKLPCSLVIPLASQFPIIEQFKHQKLVSHCVLL